MNDAQRREMAEIEIRAKARRLHHEIREQEFNASHPWEQVLQDGEVVAMRRRVGDGTEYAQVSDGRVWWEPDFDMSQQVGAKMQPLFGSYR